MHDGRKIESEGKERRGQLSQEIMVTMDFGNTKIVSTEHASIPKKQYSIISERSERSEASMMIIHSTARRSSR